MEFSFAFVLNVKIVCKKYMLTIKMHYGIITIGCLLKLLEVLRGYL